MTSIPTAVLGRTGLKVTRLGYGGAHRKFVEDSQRGKILNAVLDAGINYIDTAGCYGNSEDLIGRYLSTRRSEFYIATKCGCVSTDDLWIRVGRKVDHYYDRKNVITGLHRSLKRLKTDHIDVIQPHNPNVEQVVDEDLVKALVKMKEQGKIRWIGISTSLPHLPTYLRWDVFDVFQLPYSAFQRDLEGWIVKAANAGVGIVINGGVAMGEPGQGIGEITNRWEKYDEAKLDDLRNHGESKTSFVLRYTLTHPNSDTNIVGTSNLNHLIENIEAVKRGPIPENIYAEVRRRLTNVGISPEKVT